MTAAAAGACLALLSGCMTTSKTKPEQTASATEPAPEVVMRSPAEQLAAELNAKAEVQARTSGAYRDPQVRTTSGQQLVAQPQTSTGLYPNAPQTPAPGATAPANIGGLITQPTSVNANRSSIYAAPAPIAANPDGTLAPVSAYAAPPLRNVYSLPPGATAGQAPTMPGSAAGTSAQSIALGAAPSQPAPSVASSGGRPTADATPSHVLPAPGNGHHRTSQEALMMARNLASGGQGAPQNPMMPQASSGLTLPPGVSLPPGVTLTPGMAASLK